MMPKRLFTLLLLAYSSTTLSATPPQISYSVENNPGQLIAKLNGKQHLLEANKDFEYSVISVVSIKDFDGDGIKDALYLGAIGNCCAPTYKLATYKPSTGFKTLEIAEAWEDPTLKQETDPKTQKKRWVMTFFNSNEGMNNDDFKQTKSRYTILNGKPVLLAQADDKEIPALTEIRSNQLSAEQIKQDSIDLLKFDLDQDGKQDHITGYYWERWGRIMFKVKFANGKKSEGGDFNCKRLGILASKTKGVHDLVCDASSKFIWTGKTYQAKADNLHN